MGFNLDFLDKNLWQPAGKGLSEVDRFVDREMPFDSGWGAPAAAVAAYFAAPYMMSAMGPSAAGVGGEGAAAGGSGMLSSLGGSGGSFGGELFQLGGSAGGGSNMLNSLGGTGGSFGGDLFQLGGGVGDYTAGINPSMLSSMDTNALNQLAAQNGVSQGEPSWFDNLIGNNEQGLYDQASGKSSFAQNLGKQLMQNKPGSQMGQNMNSVYNEPPVQRQNDAPRFAPSTPIQTEKSDILKLAALLRKKDKE